MLNGQPVISVEVGVGDGVGDGVGVDDGVDRQSRSLHRMIEIKKEYNFFIQFL